MYTLLSTITSRSTDHRREGIAHPNCGSDIGHPITKFTTLLSLHSRLWLFNIILSGGATSCSRLEKAAGAQTFPWWILVISGIFMMILTAYILKRGVDSPGVTVDAPPGCSKEATVVGGFLCGALVTAIGVLSVFFPILGVWVKGYSNTVEAVETAKEVIVFVAIQLFILGFLVVALRKVVVRRESVTRGDVTLGLIWVVLTSVYFYWIVSSGRFHKAYIDPFLFLYHFVFG
jgi:hypothetical protein